MNHIPTQETGLWVHFKTEESAVSAEELLKESDFTVEESFEASLFFRENPEFYDELEVDLNEFFIDNDITGYSFEGV